MPFLRRIVPVSGGYQRREAPARVSDELLRSFEHAIINSHRFNPHFDFTQHGASFWLEIYTFEAGNTNP